MVQVPLASLSLDDDDYDNKHSPAVTNQSQQTYSLLLASDQCFQSRGTTRPGMTSDHECPTSQTRRPQQHHPIGQTMIQVPPETHDHLPLMTNMSDQAFARIRHHRTLPKKKQVTFTHVHVREHAITVGDHDWCEGSLPIQLDWQHTPTHVIPVDDFEWRRERQGRTPRGRLPKLDPMQRKRLLRRVAGITEEDLFLLERQHIDSKYIALQRPKIVTLSPNKQ